MWMGYFADWQCAPFRYPGSIIQFSRLHPEILACGSSDGSISMIRCKENSPPVLLQTLRKLAISGLLARIYVKSSYQYSNYPRGKYRGWPLSRLRICVWIHDDATDRHRLVPIGRVSRDSIPGWQHSRVAGGVVPHTDHTGSPPPPRPVQHKRTR
eukprot:614102-Pyramimonas_sp.AAC.1